MTLYCFWMYCQPLFEVVAATREEAIAKAYHSIACDPADDCLVLLWEIQQ